MLATLALTMTLVAPPTDQALLDDLSRKAVQFFWEQSNPKTGLTKDRAANFKDKDDYRVASVAATGFALAAYSIGAHRGWLDRDKALARSEATVQWLNQHALKEHGWFYHFIDWETGERIWKSEASSIDTGLLLAGELIAQSEFKSKRLDKLVGETLGAIDWHWMLTNGGAMPDAKTLCMGWHPEDGFIKARWDQQWEEMFLNVIALGAYPEMPTENWKSIKREPVVDYDGYKLLLGGPIFLHQMSQGFLDYKGKRDSLGYDYWVEGRSACLANRKYCINNPKKFKGYGPDFFGLNAGDAPTGYVGNGAPGFGSDDGTISPTGAIATILYDRKVALSAANHLAKEYPKSYGRYGFSNGINPKENWTGPDVIGIDLGMELLALESARDGLPQKLSLRNPINKRGLERAGFHTTHEGPVDKRPLQIKAETPKDR